MHIWVESAATEKIGAHTLLKLPGSEIWRYSTVCWIWHYKLWCPHPCQLSWSLGIQNQTLELLFYYVKTTELPELCTGEQMFAWRQFSKTTQQQNIGKNPFTQPLSLLLSVSNLSYHQIFSSKPSSWKAAGERVMMLLEREAPTVVQQYAAFSQPFCNKRLKDEHEFHLLSFLLQQKCCECLEMGSLAYLR